jgi:DNA mismatch repair protein MutS2
MKAVGLMQLMVQAGLPVPVNEISEFGIFTQIFTDIGDSQSLEDDLSTYSSRLELAKNMVLLADSNSLMLIDEFGSGTDPQIGGAIAEAILEALHNKKVHAVVTTHYANLKIFAHKTTGMINASMFFDRLQLKPTYELKVGRPGSSYAFEIAEKIGLPKDIMKYVERRLGKTDKAVDQMLIELQEEKKQTEEHLKALEQKQKMLDALMKNYEQLQKDLERQRKQIKLDATRQQQELTALQNRELENVIREIREEQNLERAKLMAEQAKEKKRQLELVAESLNNEVATLDLGLQSTKLGVEAAPEWRVGDTAMLRTSRGLAVIESVNKQDAVVTVGGLRVNVKLRDLLPTDETVAMAKPKYKTDLVEKAAAFQPELDIRGVVPSDAVRLVENFVDNALVSGISQLRIVHGKGSGVMRNVVKTTLKDYKNMLQFHHPEPNEGGDGVTVVHIK